MYEVFNPFTGETKYTVPFKWMARFITRRGVLDYAKRGEGWVN